MTLQQYLAKNSERKLEVCSIGTPAEPLFEAVIWEGHAAPYVVVAVGGDIMTAIANAEQNLIEQHNAQESE